MKKMTEKEKTIQLYMSKLDLSHEEAEQMWQDEQEDNLPDLTAEQKAVVKEMTQADRKKESTPRKRERKPDNDKRLIIDFLNSGLIDFCHDFDENCIDDDVIVTNPEREIEFTFKGNRYRLTLSKPRKEKSA
jgi:predicted RNA-binding protein Jag